MLYRSPAPLPYIFNHHSIFIAGGISHCPDWQTEIAELFDPDLYDMVNPRREGGFDNTGITAQEQITWEHQALSLVDNCVFWFPCESLCPISLFQLGVMLERASHHSVKLVVGWHEDYQRAFDLQVQINLASNAREYVTYAPGWQQFKKNITNTWR
ncbi:Nucleoside 2-deoxyribosyltransferase like [uncultured Caudovirales phage]|uniref:Nucleoside 2-deoxyribosyltransferase like n=1 Tax=uncultured Caudovirales phage TaxID=2100421 RepID=A0A6J5KL82_9CAUD|nr:Nucleoside 2-deoxyribosyltransferase like [uncultured Caudovirales phage]